MVRPVVLQSCGQPLIGRAHLLERAHPGGDPPVQFRQGDLQREVEGGQAEAAGLPAGAALGAAQQLKHRYRQGFPQRRPEARLIELHRGERGGADHGLHPFAAEQIGHAPLYGLLPQAAHPQGPRRQTGGAQGCKQGISQVEITALPQGAIEHHADPWTRLLTPVVGLRVGKGSQAGRLRPTTIEQSSQAGHHRPPVGQAPFAQAAPAGFSQRQLHRAQPVQLVVLIGRAGHNQQVPPGFGRGPVAKLFKAVGPMSAAAEQAHDHQLRIDQAGAQPVIDHRRVLQRRQVEGAQIPPWSEGLRLGIEQGGQGSQIGIGAAEQHDRRRRLFDEDHPIVGAGTAGNGREAMHGPIVISGAAGW